MIAAVVDTDALIKVVWTSLAAGIGVCIAYSLVVLGLTKGGEARREGRTATMVPYYALAGFGLLVCAFSLWRGYLFVVHKS